MMIETEILKWGGIAGAISAIIALITLVWKAYKRRRDKKQQERLAFQNTVLDELKGIKDKIEVLDSKVTETQENTAELQCNELKHAYNSFMRLGYCPTEDKARILDLYDKYHKKGYNSLADGFAQDIKELPAFPPDSKDKKVS